MNQLTSSIKFNIALIGMKKAFLLTMFACAFIGLMLSMFGPGIILHAKMLLVEINRQSIDALPAIGREILILSLLIGISLATPVSIAAYLCNSVKVIVRPNK